MPHAPLCRERGLRANWHHGSVCPSSCLPVCLYFCLSVGNGHVRARWTLSAECPLLPWTPRVVFTGVSAYTLDAAGKVVKHVDHWDSCGEDELPVLPHVRDGQGEAVPGGEGELELDVRALAPLITGWLTPQQLAATSRLSGPSRALATATQLFAGPSPWMPDRF